MPHCNSFELYKGVLAGKSTAVFNGKIFVRQDAQKTDSKQTNQNLLLSRDATIDTKPQLEIFADDVRCTHGATVGQLDEDALSIYAPAASAWTMRETCSYMLLPAMYCSGSIWMRFARSWSDCSTVSWRWPDSRADWHDYDDNTHRITERTCS
jgi:ABC-type transport system involved in Fe-S cluster assembly, permease component